MRDLMVQTDAFYCDEEDLAGYHVEPKAQWWLYLRHLHHRYWRQGFAAVAIYSILFVVWELAVR